MLEKQHVHRSFESGHDLRLILTSIDKLKLLVLKLNSLVNTGLHILTLNKHNTPKTCCYVPIVAAHFLLVIAAELYITPHFLQMMRYRRHIAIINYGRITG